MLSPSRFVLWFTCSLALVGCQDELPTPGIPQTAREYVNASVRLHDPQGRWPAFAADVALETSLPQTTISWVNDIHLDRAKDTFSRELIRSGYLLTQSVSSTGECSATWPNPNATQQELLQNGLLEEPCRYIDFRRKFFDYLIGLPMVALEGDPRFSESVKEITVYGEPCFEVQLDYSTDGSEPTWYLYLSTEDYRLIASRFDYSGRGGEWIYYPTLVEFDGFLLKGKQIWYEADGATEISSDQFSYVKVSR